MKRRNGASAAVPAFGSALGRGLPGRRSGQAVVELLLVFPVFMLMLFFIMELGNIAYQTILVHHSAYELARIGSLLAGGDAGGARVVNYEAKMRNTLCSMFPAKCGQITMEVGMEPTFPNPQVLATGGSHMNTDLIVKLVFPARLVFPGASYFLANPRGRGVRKITVVVRMPVESPVFQ